MAVDWLIPNGDGTIATSSTGDGTAPWFDSIDDYSTTDGSGTHDSDTTWYGFPNKVNNAISFFLLDDTSVAFDPTGATFVAKIAYRRESAGVAQSADTVKLSVQVFKSDQTTALTNEVFVNSNLTLPTTYTLENVTLTQTGTPTKADWDGARVRLKQTYTAGGTADTTARARVTAFALQITWTPQPPSLTAAAVGDSDRSWTNEATNVNLTASRAIRRASGANYSAGAAIPGLSIRVGGADGSTLPAQYVSGDLSSGGAGVTAVVVSVPLTIANGQTVEAIYDSGATGSELVAVSDAQEVSSITLSATNSLTKRVRRLLHTANGSTINSTTVKYAICEYGNGDPTNSSYGTRTDKGTAASDGSGFLDVAYSGSTVVGGVVFLDIITPDSSPTQAFTWMAAVD